jgi:ADP-ribosylglycohydrolase
MLAAGMDCFIDLTTVRDKLEPYAGLLDKLSGGRARHLSFAVPDMSVPDDTTTMTAILDAIDEGLDSGHKVYVHCWGGIGRTGTVIGCWLRRHFPATDGRIPQADGTLLGLDELWRTCPKSAIYPESPQTPQQRAFVAAWPLGMRPEVTEGMLSRARGCMLGQLAGDSLGSLVEFQSQEAIRQRYPDGPRLLANGGSFNTLAGQPTDDSEMALLLSRSIISKGGWHAEAVWQQYRFWLDSNPFDCGGTIGSAIQGQLNPSSQANGALMRVSPIGIAGAGLPVAVVASWAEQDAGLTHPNKFCLEINVLYACAIAAAIRDSLSAEELYRYMLALAKERHMEPSIVDILKDARDAPPADFMHQMGWVRIAFHNAVYQLLNAASLEEGVVDSVARGGDTDTNAAIAGALLGAVHGEASIPAQWREAILSCRPRQGDPGVRQSRPECFWPVDALELADKLLRVGFA